MSSVMLRGMSESARQLECEAMTGVVVTSSTSWNVLSETWEMSTIMPRRFISRTTCRPKSVRPLWRGASVEESAQSLLRKWVRVMERTPRRWYVRSTARSSSIWWPPSRVRMAAMRPAPAMRSTSAAVVASSIVSGCASSRDCMASRSRSVARTASAPW